MRDRLIELLAEATYGKHLVGCDALADHLLANGVIVIPCRCEGCGWFKPYDKVEDFDGFCRARECETDKQEFCSYAKTKALAERSEG